MTDITRNLFTGILFMLAFAGSAQTVKVKSIEIYGLKRTREAIVHKELTFQVGDSIVQTEIGEVFERNQNNLLNLGLFNEASLNIFQWDTEKDEIEIVVEVVESWYIYAMPIVEIADRNFNVWWTTYNHSFDRLNLGARLDYLNFSGRNDKLKLKWQAGYTPKQEFEYRFPYFNKRQSLGMTLGFLHSTNKEVNFATINNQQEFVSLDDKKLLDRVRGEVKFQYRPSLYLNHELSWTYEVISVHPHVLEFNPQFFRKGRTRHSVLITRYVYEYDERDLKIYPSKGIKAVFEAEKTGWGMIDDENTLTSTVSMEWNHLSGVKWLHRISGIGQYSLSRSQPSFNHYKAMGYDRNFVRGYELYVIDGLDYLIGKYQLSYNLLTKYVNWKRLMPVQQFRRMPLEIYLSIHLEAGRVHDPYTSENNPLANMWLFGQGAGFNLLLYHNYLIQLNVNRNHLGEVGFFIHNQTSF